MNERETVRAGREPSSAPHARVLRRALARYSSLRGASAREHRAWRNGCIVELRERRETSPAARKEPLPEEAVDTIASMLLEITRILDAEYGTPDLGNKADPVDELVYIILARRTREGAYQSAFEALRAAYRSWEDLARASEDEIERVIGFSGLGWRKAQSLKQALGALIDRFGQCTLEPTRSWTDDTVRDFLGALPEIGPKSAACVMMCSLDRPAFPVDAHVGRVLERLGVFRTLDIELEGADHKVKQRLLWHAVPPALRYPLHVNMLVHGRRVCLPRKPRCTSCVLLDRCSHGLRASASANGV